MNPLATEFTPSTSPETRDPQLTLTEESRHASRAAAPSSACHAGQASVGSASTAGPLPPHPAHPFRFAMAQDETSLFPDSVWGLDEDSDSWNLFHPSTNHPAWQEAAHCFPQVSLGLTNQTFGFEVPCGAPIPTAESIQGNTYLNPFQVGLNLRHASRVGEADSGCSYTAEGLTQSHSIVTQLTPVVRQYNSGNEHLGYLESHEHLFPSRQEANGSAATSALRHGCTLAEQLETPRPPQSANRQVSAASGPQQMLYPRTSVPLQLGPNALDASSTKQVPFLVLGDHDWPPLQPSTAGAGSNPKSRNHRDRSTRRASRSGRTTRQWLQDDVGPRNLFQLSDGQDQGVPSRGRLDQGIGLQSLHGHPLQHEQPRNVARPIARSSAPISIVSPSTPLMEDSDSTPGRPPPSPLQVPFTAWLDLERAAYADTSVGRRGDLLTRKGVDEHQNLCPPPELDKRDAIGRHLRSFETLALRHSLEHTGHEFRGTLHSGGQDGGPDMEREVGVPRHYTGSPGPPGVPRPDDTSPANGRKLGRPSSQSSDARMVPAGGAAPREVVGASGVEAQSSRTHGIVEPGSWTNSKRWMSEQMKERQSFSKMITNLRHIGADKSPCIPQSITELAALKAETAEENRKQLARVVRRRLAELELRKDLLQAGSERTGTRVDKLLWGRRFRDGASPVFATNNCFSAGEGDSRVDWPSLAELKEEGERRGGRYHRCLPLPRLNAIDPRLLVAAESVDFFHPDGTIRWQAKAVSANRAFVMPVSPPEDGYSNPRSRELAEHSHVTTRGFRLGTERAA